MHTTVESTRHYSVTISHWDWTGRETKYNIQKWQVMTYGPTLPNKEPWSKYILRGEKQFGEGE